MAAVTTDLAKNAEEYVVDTELLEQALIASGESESYIPLLIASTTA